MPTSDDDFLARLEAAALRARASGFDGVADAIEEILRRELDRMGRIGSPGEGSDASRPPEADRDG